MDDSSLERVKFGYPGTMGTEQILTEPFTRRVIFISIFTHLKTLHLSEAIHNFKGRKLFRFDKMKVNYFKFW